MSSRSELSQDNGTTAVGSGPPLLLAHGGGSRIEANFGPMLAQLAAAHRTIGVDYPGSGRSPRSSQPLTLDMLAERLVAAADAEAIEQFAVAGFSLGGPVAIRLAARYPERVTALVLTATFARTDARLSLAVDIWSRLYASGDRHLLAEYLILMALSDGTLEAAGPDSLHARIDALAAALAPGTPEQVALLRHLDLRADAAQITAPTLILSTLRDRLVSRSLQRELHALIPGSQLRELDSGHLVSAEVPGQWTDDVLAFLGAAGRVA
jgi:pimeloyl-ACP methyl ester carboxylesterase